MVTRTLAAILLLLSASTTSVHATVPKTKADPHVFLIVLENHDWRDIEGNSSAPYINHVLLRIGAHATQYFNPPGNHPSLPNYIWLEAGDNLGITDDGPPSAHHLSTTMHLVTLLSHRHLSWRAYLQGIDGKSCPLTDSYPYATRHNPMIYFDDVTRGSTCVHHERPYAQLFTDLAHNRTPRYSLIIPDVCHDMHDDCPPLNNSVAQGDAWLRATIPAILRSHAYKENGVVFITWDEGEGDDGPIGLIALSPLARPGGTSSTHYSHSSTLRTVEEILGVRPYLRWAAQADDLSALFKRLP